MPDSSRSGRRRGNPLFLLELDELKTNLTAETLGAEKILTIFNVHFSVSPRDSTELVEVLRGDYDFLRDRKAGTASE